MKYSTLFYLALITLFGAFIRSWFFWKDSLHIDERNTLYNFAVKSVADIIQSAMTTDCNPPLYYIIDHYSVFIFGVNNFAERLPSVIFGILLIPACFYLGKEIKGETLGLISALSVATMGCLWYYSQFGRSMMLTCLVFSVLCVFFVRIIRGDVSRKNWCAIIICAVLLLYSHLFTIVPLSVLFFYLIFTKRKGALFSAIVLVFLTFPLLFLLEGIRNSRVPTWLNWYGFVNPGPLNSLLILVLEIFGYTCIFWIPLIGYSSWKYRKMEEIVVLDFVFLISSEMLVVLAIMTPMFIRYLVLLVPVLMIIGLLPVADFIDNSDISRMTKWSVLGIFTILYFAATIFAFISGLYLSKGDFLFTSVNYNIIFYH